MRCSVLVALLSLGIGASESNVDLLKLRGLMARQNQQTVTVLGCMAAIGINELVQNLPAVCPDIYCWKVTFPLACGTLGYVVYKVVQDK